ncbi:hypothetical protein Q1695_016363 [Nippostrongylus brasiliensis]|nr:hypothetical protein Q1695_016363 [Nippostrongylus brasiliensis]
MIDVASSVTQPLSRSLNADASMTHKSSATYLLHSNVRIFTNAIAALSKLGDELFLRAMPRGISLKAFNKNRSAYAVFLFVDDFFSDYDTNCCHRESVMDCRISMKNALAVFKSAYFIEKNLVSCTISIDSLGRELNIVFQHTYDVTRHFDVNVMEKHKPFTSDVNKSDLKNAVTINASEIAAFLSEMHSGYEELMMSARDDKFVFTNFVPLQAERNEGSACRTEITVQRSCFKRFSVSTPSEISFCMKEFKAILTFARQHACDVSLFFDRPGRPLIVAVESDAGYSAEFVLATVEGDDRSDEDESPGLTQQPSRLHVSVEPAPIGVSQPSHVNEAAPKIENHTIEMRRSSLCSGDEALQLAEASNGAQFRDDSEMTVGATENDALNEHLFMDAMVLEGENAIGVVDGSVGTEPEPEVMPNPSVGHRNRPRAVNVQFQRHFLGLGTDPQRQSQVAGAAIVDLTQPSTTK